MKQARQLDGRKLTVEELVAWTEPVHQEVIGGLLTLLKCTRSLKIRLDPGLCEPLLELTKDSKLSEQLGHRKTDKSTEYGPKGQHFRSSSASNTSFRTWIDCAASTMCQPLKMFCRPGHTRLELKRHMCVSNRSKYTFTRFFRH